jgi:GNAT superfamily N-acetyltransferase
VNQSDDHRSRLPLLLRSECIFLDDQALLERVAHGWLMLSPSNPTFWWGNTLFMDHPPNQRDLVEWPRYFEEQVHKRQPESRHMTFGWEGQSSGSAASFTKYGFGFFQLSALVTSHVEGARECSVEVTLRAFEDGDWASLPDWLTSQREAQHNANSYRHFAERSSRNWQRLHQLDRGNWFGAFKGQQLVSALGLYVQARPDQDGRRLARYQMVTTDSRWQRQGIASALITLSAREIALRHAPTDFVIQAEANGAPRRVYEALGFREAGSSFGLERPPLALARAT